MKSVESVLSGALKFKTIATVNNEYYNEFNNFKSFIKAEFPLLNKMTEFIEVNNGFIFKIKGIDSSAMPCLLMAHCDVVKEVGEWEYPPFSGEIAGGSVYGRGAVDTKGSLISTLYAVEKLLEENFEFSCDLYILSTANEEFTGEDGKAASEYFKNKNIKFRLTLDEGGAIMENPIAGVSGKFAMIALSERASVRLAAYAVGKRKALRLANFMQAVEKKRLFKAEFTKEVLEMFKKLTPNMSKGMKFIFKNLFLTKPLLKRVLPKMSEEAKAMVMPTVSLSDLTAAEKESVPYDAVTTGLTVAHTYNDNQESVLGKIEKLSEKYCVKLVKISSRGVVMPEPINSEGYKLIEKTVLNTFKDVTPCPFLLFGGTDARFFIGISNSVIRFAPLALTSKQFGSFHKNNENIDISALTNAVEFYKNLIKSL